MFLLPSGKTVEQSKEIGKLKGVLIERFEEVKSFFLRIETHKVKETGKSYLYLPELSRNDEVVKKLDMQKKKQIRNEWKNQHESSA